MTAYLVTYLPTSDPRRSAKPAVTRRLYVVDAFTTGNRHYVRFAPPRGYPVVLGTDEVVRVELAP